MSKYQYRREADASRLFYIADLKGLPTDVTLNFSNFHIRIYRSRSLTGFFSATLAIPAAGKDSEGYVTEIDISSMNVSDEGDARLDEGDRLSERYFPLNDHSYQTIAKKIKCEAKEIIEMGRRSLTIAVHIGGTPLMEQCWIPPDMGLYEFY